MKPRKIVSLLLVASLSFGAVVGCTSADEVGTEVDEIVSAIPAEPAVNAIDAYYAYLEGLEPVDIEEVLANPDVYSVLDVAKAGYDKLKANNIELESEDIQRELTNILLFASHPMGLTEDEYQELVGKLSSTLKDEQNVFLCYYPFAAMRHVADCPEIHESTEFGMITCPSLENQWEECGPKDLEGMLEQEFATDEAYLRIRAALSSNPTLTIEDYLNELENLAIESLTPTDFYDDETWNRLFGNLEATLTSEESLYEVYIILAIRVHNMFNPDNKIDLPEDFILERA